VWAGDRPGADPPVVLPHPGWGDSTIWDSVLRRLGTRLRTVRYDLRGYRRSPAPTVPFTPFEDLRAGAAGIPGCREIAVPGSDHMLPLRVPDLVAEQIFRFADGTQSIDKGL
jgi:pimeloyl-ACP methyl ester carboxylesterase